MATNYKEMFKTVTLSKNQLNDMLNAQTKGMDYLEKNESNSITIAAAFVGFVGTLLALVFFKSTATGVGVGIASLVTGTATSMKQSILAQAQFGYTDLLKTHRTMTNLGAVSVNMEAAYVEVYNQATLETIITFLSGNAINWYALPDGTKVTA